MYKNTNAGEINKQKRAHQPTYTCISESILPCIAITMNAQCLKAPLTLTYSLQG